jgi:enoyl-CoA hydratase/carnithine racemase
MLSSVASENLAEIARRRERSMNDAVRLQREGPLAVLTLDNPPLNLFDARVFDGLGSVVQELTRQPPRGLLVRAEGRVVSGGVDVRTVFEGMTPAEAHALWNDQIRTIWALEDLPCPTIFAAHGLCLTAAFELALACDILLASETATFGLVEVVVGLTPSMGGTQRLAERAGPARAKEMVFTGELFDAATLERWNVVNRVFPSDDFDTGTRAFAAGLASGPTRAHAVTKMLVRARDGGGARGADVRVGELSSMLFETEDLQGAVSSFLSEGPGKASYRGR